MNASILPSVPVLCAFNGLSLGYSVDRVVHMRRHISVGVHYVRSKAVSLLLPKFNAQAGEEIYKEAADVARPIGTLISFRAVTEKDCFGDP